MQDVALAQQIQKNGLLDKPLSFLTTKTTFLKSGAPATNLVDASYVFGSSTNDKGKFLIISNYVNCFVGVTSVTLEAKVVKSLEANGNTTAINAWLMTQADLAKFAPTCNPSCTPPQNLAIKGTFCSGLKCTTTAKNLNGVTPYCLFVSYPTIISAQSPNNWFATGPAPNPYPAQAVSIVAKAQFAP